MATLQGLHLLFNRVIVQRIPTDELSAGGIIMPGDKADRANEAMTGTVIAVGTGGREDEGEVPERPCDVGDEIFFGPWAGEPLRLDGELYHVLNWREIYGLVELES